MRTYSPGGARPSQPPFPVSPKNGPEKDLMFSFKSIDSSGLMLYNLSISEHRWDGFSVMSCRVSGKAKEAVTDIQKSRQHSTIY